MKVGFLSIVVMFLWALCFPLIELSQPFAPLILTTFLRAGLSGVALLALASILRRPLPSTRKDWVVLVVIGFTATSIGFWGMFYAGGLLSPGIATVLANTQPLVASLLGWFFLKERLHKRAILGIGVGFSGIALISLNALEFSNEIDGTIVVLIAAVSVAISNVLLKSISARVDVYYAMGFQFCIGAIPLGALSYFQGDFQSLRITIDFAYLLAIMTVFGTAIPFLLWYWLLKQAPLYKVNAFSFLTPIFGLLMGRAFFSETLSMFQLLGVAMILLSIWLVNKTKSRT